MKIIDLLNKIANGEEIPKKIKYKNEIYEWKEYDVCYGKIMTKKGWVKEYGYVAEVNRTYFYLKHCYQDLNDEVEILEEKKKIPTLNDIRESYGLPRIEEKKIPDEIDINLAYIDKEYLLDKEDIDRKINEIINRHNILVDKVSDYLKSKGE